MGRGGLANRQLRNRRPSPVEGSSRRPYFPATAGPSCLFPPLRSSEGRHGRRETPRTSLDFASTRALDESPSATACRRTIVGSRQSGRIAATIETTLPRGGRCRCSWPEQRRHNIARGGCLHPDAATLTGPRAGDLASAVGQCRQRDPAGWRWLLSSRRDRAGAGRLRHPDVAEDVLCQPPVVSGWRLAIKRFALGPGGPPVG